MAQLTWSKFLRAHARHHQVDVRWHLRRSRTIVGVIPSPFEVLARALRARMQGNWAMQSLGVDIQVILADGSDARAVIDLFRSCGSQPERNSPIAYGDEQYESLRLQYYFAGTGRGLLSSATQQPVTNVDGPMPEDGVSEGTP